MGTIMQALDEKLGNPTPSQTIVEALGGHNGETIAKAVEENELLKPNPLKGLKMDFNIAADEDLFGKIVSDLQEDMAVVGNKITGTLKYVTGYTGFSSKTAEQQGNYLAMHFSIPGQTIGQDGLKVKVNGSNLDADGLIVLIMNKQLKPITAIATMGDDSFTLKLDPKALVLEPEPVVEEPAEEPQGE